MWRLEVSDWTSPTGWRWRLFDGADAVADHTVALDPTAWQFEAFTDLYGYLGWNAGPDRHPALLAEVGDWIGRQVLGPVGEVIAAARQPVRLELPAQAAVLGYRPWELASVGGTTLAAARVRVVVTAVPHRPLTKRGVGEQLRMLAVFSLPDGSGALNLRRERFELARLVHRIARVNGKAIELRVLQYGATRQRLQDSLLEEPGWDVVHLSGHGLPAGLVLEDDAGRHDTITSTELVDLLDLAADQVKLVTLSACESAAVTAAEHLHLLGLAPTRDADRPADDAGRLPAVAAEVVSRLDCAVLAMRYPVLDEFAIDLAGSFYDLLLGKGHPVAGALGLSLAPGRASELSIATPALFGNRAVDLTLVPPAAGPSAVTVRDDRLAEFPDQPPRFVGRVGPLTRAAAALAPGSGRPAVVLHGMAGAGKTACAAELAYTHVESFPLVAWWAAPPDGTDIRPAMTAFALATERQIPGLEWVHLVDHTDTLRDFLPKLTEIVEQNRILLVVDNAESLLTDDGQWRDDRWGAVLTALTAHRGLSRLVLTTRRLPAGLPDTVVVEPIHALSLPESMLLARELPGLRALIDGDGRDLVARVLRLAQGHPKLLELADGAAADPAALTARLDDADRLWLTRGTTIDTFLRQGTSTGSDADFGNVLAGWTRSTTAQLPPAPMLLFRLFCGLEAGDREPRVLAHAWPRLWERTGHDTAPPDLTTVLPVLVDRALLAPDTDPDNHIISWRVHPGIADTTRTDTDPTLTDLIDDTLADAWMVTLHDAQERESEQLGAWLLRAARSAAPYLLRRHRWTDLDTAAEHVLARDPSVSAAAGLAPLLDVATAATHGTDHELDLARTHARTVLRLDPDRGTTLLHNLLDTAANGNNHASASALAGDLINRFRDEGRYDEALTLADRKIDYTRRAGYGPWTQLADQTRRLQIQRNQGHHREALDGFERLRAQMADLPIPPDPTTEVVVHWNVREGIFSEGALAAQDLQLWERALELNAENLASKQERGASTHEQAWDAFNDYFSLVRLGRLTQARELLISCRTDFEAASDIPRLGKVLSGLADVESEMGHPDRAIDLEQQALRFTYAAGAPGGVEVSHHNLANYLHLAGADPTLIAAHRMAAAVVSYQTGSGRLPDLLAALGQFLAANPDSTPRSFTEVCHLVDQTPGVNLAALLQRLPRRAPDGDTAMRAVLGAAPHSAAADTISRQIEPWEPALAALHTATTHPDPGTRAQAASALDTSLTPLADTDDWRALVATLRCIHNGDRDPATLLPGLDDIDTAITRRALDILAGTATVDPTAWLTPEADDGLAAFATAIAAAAAGDDPARAEVDAAIEGLAANEGTAALAAVLRRLLDGADDPTADTDLPPDQAEFPNAVRRHLDPPTPTNPPESP